jgi:hypothetical protein
VRIDHGKALAIVQSTERPGPNNKTASNRATTISFDPVGSASVRLKLISPHPNESNGFFQIAELQLT